ncbi:hypothetical protein ACQJBY_018897 [Aegilops geniculata]
MRWSSASSATARPPYPRSSSVEQPREEEEEDVAHCGGAEPAAADERPPEGAPGAHAGLLHQALRPGVHHRRRHRVHQGAAHRAGRAGGQEEAPPLQPHPEPALPPHLLHAHQRRGLRLRRLPQQQRQQRWQLHCGARHRRRRRQGARCLLQLPGRRRRGQDLRRQRAAPHALRPHPRPGRQDRRAAREPPPRGAPRQHQHHGRHRPPLLRPQDWARVPAQRGGCGLRGPADLLLPPGARLLIHGDITSRSFVCKLYNNYIKIHPYAT